MKKPDVKWNEDTQTAEYTIYYKDMTFTGKTSVRPGQRSYGENVGINIAQCKALRKYLRYVINHELKPGLYALKRYYYSINKSKQYNENSYEAKMLKRQIKGWELDIQAVKDEISDIDLEMQITLKALRKMLNREDKNDENC